MHDSYLFSHKYLRVVEQFVYHPPPTTNPDLLFIFHFWAYDKQVWKAHHILDELRWIEQNVNIWRLLMLYIWQKCWRSRAFLCYFMFEQYSQFWWNRILNSLWRNIYNASFETVRIMTSFLIFFFLTFVVYHNLVVFLSLSLPFYSNSRHFLKDHQHHYIVLNHR